MEEFIDKIKDIYKVNNIIIPIHSNNNFLLELGYPKDFINKLDSDKIKNSYPVAFPFKDIQLFNKNILDIGCGIGIDCYYSIYNLSKFVLGIDISFSLLQNSIANNKILGDAQKLPLKNKPFFDIINFNGSFNQIVKKFSLLNYLYEILKKDGIIIICDLMWIGEYEELQYYKSDSDFWIFNIGGCLTEESIWNIECNTLFKILKFEKFEKEFPIQKYRLILKK